MKVASPLVETGNFFDLKNSKKFWTCIFDMIDASHVHVLRFTLKKISLEFFQECSFRAIFVVLKSSTFVDLNQRLFPGSCLK